MQAMQSYLFFNGNCREAMEFYAGVLGAKLDIFSYGEAPEPRPAGSPDRIMHATLSAGTEPLLMAADFPEDQTMTRGNNFNLSYNCTSRDQQEGIFAALSEGGKVHQPLGDTFWGSHFGMLHDKFGVGWMLNHHVPH